MGRLIRKLSPIEREPWKREKIWTKVFPLDLQQLTDRADKGAKEEDLGESSEEEEFPYDLEIERTLHRRREEARRRLEEEEEVPFEEPREEMVANANLSLRQIGTPDLNHQPLCITFPTLDAIATFELKSGLIHLLPLFHGLAGEDPHKYLMEFHVVCTSMKPAGVTEEQIQLRAFLFSLKNAAKDWLYYLPPGSITTWTEMKRIFLEKYFPSSRAANIRKEIYGIKQYMGESLHEYWERSMVEAASGGVFVDKTPQDARNLIENMAANSQQFGTSRGIGQTVKVCGICTVRGHATDMCPILQEKKVEQIMPQEDFQGQHREIMILTRIHTTQETRASIQHLNTQVGQLATVINRLEAQNSSSLPSQTVPNPKENVSAITLRSGRELKVREEVVQELVKNEDDKKSKVEEDETVQKDTEKVKFPPLSKYKPIAPFPLALKQSRKDEGIKELYDTFSRCELDTAMLDLGASINVMPYSTYASLKLGPLNKTAIVIQMANRSTNCPRGVLEDVLVKVGNLVFSADFYVLDMKNNDLNSSILLGRPFLTTSKSIIDVSNGTLTMQFDGKIVPKVEPKLPPDRAKGIPMKKEKDHQEIGIPKRSNERKHGQKLTVKMLKWVKVDKVIKYEPP
ncbi:uncharacterized protein [Henckelia pumila]|uniref:uncharacterized protein n=1 Tax=Henckelia pumila TaxID=405737 RepID=UPI003C6DBE7A